MVVTIATPPIQMTTARTCSARATATSSMAGLVSAHSAGRISDARPRLWTSAAPGARQIGERIAVERPQERQRRFAQRVAQDAATLDRQNPVAARHPTTASSSSISRTTAPTRICSGEPRQPDPAALAADRIEIALLAELVDDLHQVGLRDVEACGDLGNRREPPAQRAHIDQRAQRIIGPKVSRMACFLPRRPDRLLDPLTFT